MNRKVFPMKNAATAGWTALALTLIAAFTTISDTLYAATIDSTEVSFVKHRNGVSTTNIAFEALLTGTDISSASVTPPGGSPIPLVFDPLSNDWAIDDDNLEATILASYPDFGMYTFDVNFTGGGSASQTVNFGTQASPTVDYPTTIPTITSLTWGSLLVEWDIPASAAGAGGADVFVDRTSTGETVYDMMVSTSDTSHIIPSNVFIPGEDYFVVVAFFNATTGSSFAVKGTGDGQDFTAPVPEPCTLLLLGSGIAGIFMRRRKRL